MTKDIERFEEVFKKSIQTMHEVNVKQFGSAMANIMLPALEQMKPIFKIVYEQGVTDGSKKLEGCVVVPVWIATDFMLPDEGEAVLFIDKHNVIHDGFLSTDYVDGPYGENGEDFGDNQTLWTSNSNGEELIQSKVKYWMARPDIQVKEPKADTEG